MDQTVTTISPHAPVVPYWAVIPCAIWLSLVSVVILRMWVDNLRHRSEEFWDEVRSIAKIVFLLAVSVTSFVVVLEYFFPG